jgi:methionyl-tRNA formyltransferase
MARVVFLGTPEFGVPVLEALIAAHEVVAVVTQPDRSGGRGRRELLAPPVKQVAERHGLDVLQPASLRRDKATVAALRALAPDVLVLAAYGQILRQDVLSLAPGGCVGVHASLLPRYRGAAPITAAILHGEAETGITLMLTDAGMDTGPMLARRALPILPDDTTASLTTRLAHLGAEMIVELLPEWLAGRITPTPQDETLATYAPQITKEDGRMDWTLPAVVLDRQVRAYTPWPGTATTLAGSDLKVLSAHLGTAKAPNVAPGTVLLAEGEIAVATGDGLLALDLVQLAGKKPATARDFARGRRDFIGAVLGGGV